MKLKSTVFKAKSGPKKGKWIARVSYYDETAGKWKTQQRVCDRRNDATDERERLSGAIEKTDGRHRTGEKMTFTELVEYCKVTMFQQAVIENGRKIEGLKSHKSVSSQLTHLKAYFGKRKIASITRESLSDYRNWRMKQGSQKQKSELKKLGVILPLKIATINRELAAMRRMMRHAYAEGWIMRDVFLGSKVIAISAEAERTRFLSPAEEIKLLDACQGERTVTYTRTRKGREETITASLKVDNPHLRALILLAVDSGMRQGEILRLRWRDIDFDNALIQIVGSHTKTEKARLVPLTDRTKVELALVQSFASDERVFPFNEFKRSWSTAKRLAGLEDLRFHDLRRTAITRWQIHGLPLAIAGKFAGHTNLQTTMKHYTASEAAQVSDFAEKLSSYHSETRIVYKDPTQFSN